MKYFRKKSIRSIAFFTLFNLVANILFPTIAYALTSGPSSPEFSSYEPVATTNMVDPFTGNFTYNLPVVNIPGPDGAGYSMSLSYHSGVNSEEEASWVGYGWTLNPGAINRNKDGFPDDFNGAEVQEYNKTRPNWSVSSTADLMIEYYSDDSDKEEDPGDGKIKIFEIPSDDKSSSSASTDKDSKEGDTQVSLTLSKSLRFNNYNGFYSTYGTSLGFKGMSSLNMTSSRSGVTFSLRIDPLKALSFIKKKADNDQEKSKEKEKSPIVEKIKSLKEKIAKAKAKAGIGRGRYSISSFGTGWFGGYTIPYSVSNYSGLGYNGSLSVQFSPINNIGTEVGASGNFNVQFSPDVANMKAYGYMHNRSHGSYGNDTYEFGNQDNSRVLTDYSLENGGTANVRDKNLAIPFNAADNFFVTGEVAAGNFRVQHAKIGHFYPNFTRSRQKIYTLGLEGNIGGNHASVGFDLGLGWQFNNVEKWGEKGQEFDESDRGIFMFSGDPGLSLNYTGEELQSESLEGARLTLPGAKSAKPSAEVNPVYSQPFSTSSNIEYHTGSDIKAGKVFNKALTTPDHPNNLNNLEIWNDDQLDDALIEYAVTSNNGAKAIYGLPCFTKDEANISLGVSPYFDAGYQIDDNKYLAYHNQVFLSDDKILDNNTTVVGRVTQQPYASTFLLTAITNVNYVDLLDDGPTDDDFGGWTKFDYVDILDGNTPENWYRYRMPYQGFNYQKGANSDPRDDMGSVSYGKKQVRFLNKIETKTHIAYFVKNESLPQDFGLNSVSDEKIAALLTGSQEKRKDAWGAPHLNPDGTDPASKRKLTEEPVQSQQYLERIVLVSKSRPEKSLQVVNFEYDYSLCKGAPNTKGENTGKLTLKKVWFENEGIFRSKIAPYEFVYNYPDYENVNPEDKYADVFNFSNAIKTAGSQAQNPPYKPYALDRWGNYQLNGDERNKQENPWVDQRPNPAFDPAAWNLKSIKLPSGGEIQVQYEQHDYKYVQDQRATIMAPLSEVGLDGLARKYSIKLEDIGLSYLTGSSDQNKADRAEYETFLKDFFTRSNQPSSNILFKFLYGLQGSADINNCKSEFIEGYAKVSDISINGDQIDIVLSNETDSPSQLCYDYFLANRDGLLSGQNCGIEHFEDTDKALFNLVEKNRTNTDAAMDAGNKAELRKIAYSSMLDAFDFDMLFRVNKPKREVCLSIKPENSYFRIPVFKSKKGGGIRVKRLLMYENGMFAERSIYGSEYHYLDNNGHSSGVASNEPAIGREENALVQLLPRGAQSTLNRLVAGEDKKQNEGPLGEKLLPAPSIGYSRVVVHNIHQGKSGTGFQVHEFNTCKDYPVKVEFTELDNESRARDWLELPLGYINLSLRKLWMTQGYRFTLNEMHGKPKKVSTYVGTYIPEDGENTIKLDNKKPVAFTETEYFDFTEEGGKANILSYDKVNKEIVRTTGIPGFEQDLAMYNFGTKDQTFDLNLELDVTIQWATPVALFLGFNASFAYSQKEYGTHVVNKVNKYPCMVKSTTSYADGVLTKSENLAFDKNTGQVLVTRTYDGYHDTYLQAGSSEKHFGAYTSYSIPAAWIYPGMGQQSLNPSNTNQLTDKAMSFVTYGKQQGELEWFDQFVQSENGRLKPEDKPVNNVVNASATVFGKNWFQSSDQDQDHVLEQYLTASAELSNASDPISQISARKEEIRAALNKTYRPAATYVYNDEISQASEVNTSNEVIGRIYEDGTVDKMRFFNWEAKSLKDETTGKYKNQGKWLMTNQINNYSPNGVPLEEQNVLGIQSAVRFGYRGQILPVMVAQNASYESIFFQDFENLNNNVSDQHRHSGAQSFKYSFNNIYKFIDKNRDKVQLTHQMIEKGAFVKLWLKSHKVTAENALVEPGILNGTMNNTLQLPFQKVASSGEWTLYVAEIRDWAGLLEGDFIDLTLQYEEIGGEQVFIDDLRLQPLDAEVMCNVYDVKSLRLLTQFNDQHFGVYYHYDEEGKLTKQSIETDRGMKMITEQTSNINYQPRN